ncbi:hypothetical protein [Amycolatopsis sp. RTGN1]|uniref:hypothetical protein n=1 Tax=Amycolatopsis ponsaeliensis TaxID=2992142 RepID=UPI00254ED4B3|nr:hypothetical protein [Amycolatopsis sp. RTGN1]
MTQHLLAFWDDQSRQHLGDVLIGWLETQDSAGDAASKWKFFNAGSVIRSSWRT